MLIAMRTERPIDIGDCELHVSLMGSGFPLLILHGGPGLDHHAFGDYLDPLADDFQLIFIDERASGRSSRPDPATWTLLQMADDIDAVAEAFGFARYAVLGHSYGAFLALQHAVDMPRGPNPVIISAGLPSSRFLEGVADRLAAFEPLELREQVSQSWAKEASVSTVEEFAQLMHEQLPFHFADPMDPRIADYERRTAETTYAPDVLRAFAESDYGGIEVEGRLGAVQRPMLILAGRHDRTCPVEGAEAIAEGVAGAQLEVFEKSGHMMYVEETDHYLEVVRDFLRPFS
jgi:proline-specific peptidase